MKKIILLFCFILMSSILFSQNGKITYTLTISDTTKINENIKDTYQSLLTLAKDDKYDLSFNQNFSKFDINERIGVVDNSYNKKLSKIARRAFGCGDRIFINKSYQEIIEATEDNVLISTIGNKSNWNITSETKKIDQYLCYKATYEHFFTNRKGEKTSRLITAWFAPSLPYSYGPKIYYGLPGLILELTENRTTYIATKIELFEKELQIDFPKGKTITREEYDNKLKAQMGM